MKKLTFILLTVIVLFYNCQNSKLRPEIRKAVNEIAKDNLLTGHAVGPGGDTSIQWESYTILEQNATDEELKELLKHKNVAVRCYAFQALFLRTHIDIFPILLEKLYDDEPIYTQFGCEIEGGMVGDFCLWWASPPGFEGRDPLNENQLAVVDSILVFDKKINLSAKNTSFAKLKPDEKYYQRVKEVVVNEDNNGAVVALAKYRKQEDRVYIENKLKSLSGDTLYYALRAVREYPDPSFYPYLEEIGKYVSERSKINYWDRNDSDVFRMLYQAIVQYKNENSRKLLETTYFASINKDYPHSDISLKHSRNLWLALNKYPDVAYTGLQDQIILDDDDKEWFKDWPEW